VTSDLGAQWSHSFFPLFVQTCRSGWTYGLGKLPTPLDWQRCQPAPEKLDKSHYDVRVSPGRMAHRVAVWLESGGPSRSYADCETLQNQALDTKAAGRVFFRKREILSSAAVIAMPSVNRRTRRGGPSRSFRISRTTPADSRDASAFMSAWC